MPAALISTAVIVVAGFAAKLYRGPFEFWINNSLAGVFYEIFWCLLIFSLAPKARPAIIAAGVFFVTCGLEVLQLFDPIPLQAVRSTFWGASLLGTTFVWSDFLFYLIGCGIGWAWMERLKVK